MGNIKLLLLSVFFVGQLAFACGSTITGGGAGSTQQTNTSSSCPNSNLGAFMSGPVMPQQTPNFSPAAHKEMTCAQKYGEAIGKGNGCKLKANDIYLFELNACPKDTRVLTAIPSVIEAETQPVTTCITMAKEKNDITKENCDLQFEIDTTNFPLYCNKDGSVKKDENGVQ